MTIKNTIPKNYRTLFQETSLDTMLRKEGFLPMVEVKSTASGGITIPANLLPKPGRTFSDPAVELRIVDVGDLDRYNDNLNGRTYVIYAKQKDICIQQNYIPSYVLS